MYQPEYRSNKDFDFNDNCVYFNKIKTPTTINIRITTQIIGLTRTHTRIETRNINKSKIRIPAKIRIKTPTMAIINIPTADPNISAMA